MGIAGFALLFGLFFLFKSIQTIFSYISWHNKEIVRGEVGELLSSKESGKNVTKYTFSLILDTSPEKTITEYTESSSSYEGLTIKRGDIVEVYYDPNKEEKNQYRIKSELKKQLWMYPLFFLACVAVFIICTIIVANIKKK